MRNSDTELRSNISIVVNDNNMYRFSKRTFITSIFSLQMMFLYFQRIQGSKIEVLLVISVKGKIPRRTFI